MCEFAVVGERADAEINGAILGTVGVAFFDERRDHLQHPSDVLGCSGLGKMIRPFDAERVEILEERLLKWRCEVRQRHATSPTTPDRLVIHIREIHDAIDLQSPILEMALQQILKNVGAEISDVGEIVNCRPAGVEPHLPRLARHEVLDLTGQRIEKTKWHGSRSKGGTGRKIKCCLKISSLPAPRAHSQRLFLDSGVAAIRLLGDRWEGEAIFGGRFLSRGRRLRDVGRRRR